MLTMNYERCVASRHECFFSAFKSRLSGGERGLASTFYFPFVVALSKVLHRLCSLWRETVVACRLASHCGVDWSRGG